MTYHSNLEQDNKKDKEEIWGKMLPFKALGVFKVFAESPKLASTICIICASWISRRPILYPSDIETNKLKYCGKDHKYIKSLTKTIAIIIAIIYVLYLLLKKILY